LWSAPVTFAYGTERTATDLSLYDIDAPVDLGRRTITDRSTTPVDHPIWAPAVLQAAGHYALGDPITFETVTGSVTFRIQGFVEDTYGGTPGFGSLAFGLPAADFAAFAEPGFHRTTQVKIAAASPTTASEAWRNAVATATARGPVPTIVWSGDLDVITMASSMSSGIFAAILITFSAMIVLVAGVVIRFLLRNVITVDLASIGVLRGAGFTTGAIITALTTTFAVCALVAGAAGAALSYAVLPPVRQTLRAQSGMSWDQPFSWLVFGLTVGGIVGLVVLTSLASAIHLRRITTITALRGGLATHSFRAAPLPLATTRGPLTVLLGVKTALRQVQQSVVIAVTVA
ncbi:MAG: FtsX-like permease family protein, partial [Propionibacteriaceae bacterium]|nr:FtsX-like permease family protein [Propionibacteriaceae bacterium]